MWTATTASFGVRLGYWTRRCSTAVSTMGVVANSSCRCRWTKAAAGAPMLTITSGGRLAEVSGERALRVYVVGTGRHERMLLDVEGPWRLPNQFRLDDLGVFAPWLEISAE
jgi:hypothetical protein